MHRAGAPGRGRGKVGQGGKELKWPVSAVERIAPVPLVDERFLSLVEDIFCLLRTDISEMVRAVGPHSGLM